MFLLTMTLSLNGDPTVAQLEATGSYSSFLTIGQLRKTRLSLETLESPLKGEITLLLFCSLDLLLMTNLQVG